NRETDQRPASRPPPRAAVQVRRCRYPRRTRHSASPSECAERAHLQEQAQLIECRQRGRTQAGPHTIGSRRLNSIAPERPRCRGTPKEDEHDDEPSNLNVCGCGRVFRAGKCGPGTAREPCSAGRLRERSSKSPWLPQVVRVGTGAPLAPPRALLSPDRVCPAGPAATPLLGRLARHPPLPLVTGAATGAPIPQRAWSRPLLATKS